MGFDLRRFLEELMQVSSKETVEDLLEAVQEMYNIIEDYKVVYEGIEINVEDLEEQIINNLMSEAEYSKTIENKGITYYTVKSIDNKLDGMVVIRKNKELVIMVNGEALTIEELAEILNELMYE